jgi:hypothetical protein
MRERSTVMTGKRHETDNNTNCVRSAKRLHV